MKAVLRPFKILPVVVASIGLGLVACEGTEGPAGSSGPSGPGGPSGPAGAQGVPGESGQDPLVDQSLTPFQKTIEGLGGQTTLDALAGLTFTATGTRLIWGEGYTWDGELGQPAFFTYDLSWDVTNDYHKLVVDRTLYTYGYPAAQQFTATIRGDLGALDGVESFFAQTTAPTELYADRIAALKKEQRLLNPHVLFQGLDSDDVANGGLESVEGKLHHVVVLDDEESTPISVYVNALTGRIKMLSFLENDPVRSDVKVELVFDRWEETDGGVNIPLNVYLIKNGDIIAWESRTDVEVNPTFGATDFDFPASVTPMADPINDAANHSYGIDNHQYLLEFAGIGIPLDGFAYRRDLSVQEIPSAGSGIWHVTGLTHHSLVIEQDNGVVVVDPCLNSERGEDLLAWIQDNADIANKDVTHTVLSHHHRDHVAGARPLMAVGSEIVAHEASAQLYQAMFDADRTVRPDRLQTAKSDDTNLSVVITTVEEDGEMTIGGAGTNPVRVLDMDTSHCGDMVLVQLPDHNIVFAVDLYNPGFQATPASVELRDEIERLSLDDAGDATLPLLVGGHGTSGGVGFDVLNADITNAGL